MAEISASIKVLKEEWIKVPIIFAFKFPAWSLNIEFMGGCCTMVEADPRAMWPEMDLVKPPSHTFKPFNENVSKEGSVAPRTEHNQILRGKNTVWTGNPEAVWSRSIEPRPFCSLTAFDHLREKHKPGVANRWVGLAGWNQLNIGGCHMIGQLKRGLERKW